MWWSPKESDSCKRGTTMKVASVVVLVALAMFVMMSGFLHAQKPAAGLAEGVWSGRATGSDSKSFSVTLTMDGSGAGFVEYPSMKCGGQLRFVRKNGESFSYRETITHGQAKCGAAGVIDLTPDGDKLALIRSAGATKSTATLTRVDQPGPNQCATCELHYDQTYQGCYRISDADERQKCQDTAEDDLRTCEGECQQ
jgi:hypothetical protein